MFARVRCATSITDASIYALTYKIDTKLRRYVRLSSTDREARRRSKLRFNSTDVDNIPVAFYTTWAFNFFTSGFQDELKYHRTACTERRDTAPDE